MSKGQNRWPTIWTMVGAVAALPSTSSWPGVRRVLGGLLAGGSGLILLASVARAATPVNVTVPCAAAALVQAVNNANASTAATTLNLTRGCTYLLTEKVDSPNGPDGLPVITSQHLTVNGRGAVLKRTATAPPFRILEVGASGNLTLNDVTITGGDGSDGSDAGGILNDGTLALDDSRITNNVSTGATNQGFCSGGGIDNSGTAKVTASLISSNRVTDGCGGGVANMGDMLLSASRVVHNVLIGSGDGAGISNQGNNSIVYPNGNLRVQSSSIEGNTGGTFGGGIADDSGGLSIDRSSIRNNTVAGNGGGVAISDFAFVVSINRSSISNNGATGVSQALGGGIYSVSGVPVARTVVTNNTTSATGPGGQAEGGGVFIGGLDGQLLLQDHSSVTHNTATATGADGVAQGGGIVNSGGSVSVIRSGSSVTHNAATATGADGQAQGGGIWDDCCGVSVDGGSVSKNTASATGQGGQAQGGGIWNNGTARFGTISLRDRSKVTNNIATAPLGTADGGGIFNQFDPSLVTISLDSAVARNKPNNCGGPGTPITGCT